MLNLTPSERRSLRARAHALHPVVSIGDKGLSDSVINEISSSLDAHELVKVRTAEADRDARDVLLSQICESLKAAPVQHIGKILVIYRPAPEQTEPAPKRRTPGKARRTKRAHQND
ncbi:MAG TPA: YhbY family RNA-binding protein [Burkholderiales bacterium]|nr:YhbY family RNA-binding protein [Burkholderiales bacterium]